MGLQIKTIFHSTRKAAVKQPSENPWVAELFKIMHARKKERKSSQIFTAR